MKILMTNAHLSAAHGSEIWTNVVARELIRRGHDVVIFSPEIGPFHQKYMQDIPTISGPGSWSDPRFDVAIIQHLNSIRHYEGFNEYIVPSLPEDTRRIIVMCHGIHAEPEKPIVADYIQDARYTCISPEIAEHYSNINWNVIKQPIDESWFEIKDIEPAALPQGILWASHRFPIPDSLRRFCSNMKPDCTLYSAGTRPMWPEEIRDIYRQCDVVIGTGRWIYEGMAAGRVCIVANDTHQLGYVTQDNRISYEGHNMTPRHRNAVPCNWESLFAHYKWEQGSINQKYAIQNYTVQDIVDRLLESVGFQNH